ncbi:unnamed protein product [Linum trigynum]|uniref:Transposase MuDR plant domain-containing protein n=1 Tax=Linum trigynum TaxID=586398 RepID=A0AAV2CU87_9ROSI
MLEELHQMCTQITCMDGTRRVDRMVYRYPNRHDGSLWNEEFLLTTQEDVDAMVQFLTTNKIKQAEMFVYTEVVEGSVGHSGDGQTSGIHGGSVLYEDHPHQDFQESSWRQEYHHGTGGSHQSFPSYEEEAQQADYNQQAGYQYPPEYNFYQSGVSYHNYHYGASEGEGAFHADNPMEEEVNPSPVSDPEVEEEEGEVSADSDDPLEGADDSGPDSDADGDEVAHDRVPIPYYNHIQNEDWYVDADMDPLDVPVWGPLTGFTKGQQFATKNEVRHAISTEAMTRSFEWQTTHSDTKRLMGRCKNENEGCKARVRAIKSKRVGHWVISRAVNTHTCVSSITSQGHRQLKSRVVAAAIKHLIEEQPDLKVKTIIAHISSRYGYIINYKKAWHGKQKAMAVVFGDREESYAFLPILILALEVSNPGTIFSPRYQDEEIQPSVPGNNRQFKRLFWAFKPCIDGFPYCVPVTQVDGTFLTGKYKGTLLIASGADAK